MDVTIITHGIKGLLNYYFSGNDLIVLEHFSNKRTKPTKTLKKQFNGRNKMCRGYYIDRKFKSLTSLVSKQYPLTKVIVSNIKSEIPF